MNDCLRLYWRKKTFHLPDTFTALISYLSKRKSLYCLILFLTRKSTVKEKLRSRVIIYSDISRQTKRLMFVFQFFCLQVTEKKKFLQSKEDSEKLISFRPNIIGNSSVSMKLRDQLTNQSSGWLCIWRVEWQENESVLVVSVRTSPGLKCGTKRSRLTLPSNTL